MDAHLHYLHSSGVGRDVKHARVLTKEDEEKLWRSGAIGTKTSKALQNAVLYTVGKMFNLGGGAEIKSQDFTNTKALQSKSLHLHPACFKDQQWHLQKLHIANKTIPLFECPEASDHCPVHVIDLYSSKLPQVAIENDTFFVKPLENTPEYDTKPWCSRTPVVRNTLDTRLCKMCSLARRITNHSMRATSVTQMYATGVPETVIQERTGHKSLEALRVYERTNSDQHQKVSKHSFRSTGEMLEHTTNTKDCNTNNNQYGAT